MSERSPKQQTPRTPNTSRLRIGQGLDVHQLVAGRPLILGGVHIPYDRGLLGHSDADALLHSIIDALLGATGRGDIGSLFPDTDAQYKGADSKELLAKVWALVKADGWSVVNIDCTVSAEAPKLRPYIETMKTVISGLLEIDTSACAVKAGTFEKLGFIGRGEGIVASAVVLLQGS